MSLSIFALWAHHVFAFAFYSLCPMSSRVLCVTYCWLSVNRISKVRITISHMVCGWVATLLLRCYEHALDLARTLSWGATYTRLGRVAAASTMPDGVVLAAGTTRLEQRYIHKMQMGRHRAFKVSSHHGFRLASFC